MTPSLSAALLFANERFYQAFATRDMAAMDELWAERDTITCIHPGWAPLLGREAVIRSWVAILGGPSAPAIRCVSPTSYLTGESGYVLCYELATATFLAATNIFCLENGIWRMVHHQAGLTQPPEETVESEPITLQ